MNDDHLKTLAQVRAFLDDTQAVEFSLHSKIERYDFVRRSLSGPATKKLCERAWLLFNLCAYQRLAGISVSHLYNLRRSTTYQRTRRQFDKTMPLMRSPSLKLSVLLRKYPNAT